MRWVVGSLCGAIVVLSGCCKKDEEKTDAAANSKTEDGEKETSIDEVVDEKIKNSLPRLKKYLATVVTVRKEIEEALLAVRGRPGLDWCPGNVLYVDNGGTSLYGVKDENGRWPSIPGSYEPNGYRMFALPDSVWLDGEEDKAAIEALAQHKAMVLTFGGDMGVGTAVVAKHLSPQCLSASVVFDIHENKQLKSLSETVEKEGEAVVFALAALALRMMQKRHAVGLLMGSLVSRSSEDFQITSKEELKQIYFEQNAVYVDVETGKHLPEGVDAGLEHLTSLDKYVAMGPWQHGEKFVTRSRRDDVYALALSLVILAEPESSDNTMPEAADLENAEKLKLKREALFRGFRKTMPKEWVEFFDYASKMKFAEKPDYEKWIKRFEEAKLKARKNRSREIATDK